MRLSLKNDIPHLTRFLETLQCPLKEICEKFARLNKTRQREYRQRCGKSRMAAEGMNIDMTAIRLEK